MRKIRLEPGFFLCLALGLIFVPLPWLVSWLLAAAIHELAHLMALKAFGFSVNFVTLGALGAVIRAEGERPVQAACCSLAGPAAGFMLLLLYPVFPRLAFCAAVQTFVNLLPIASFDGANVLRHSLSVGMSAEGAQRVCVLVERCALILLAALALYGWLALKTGCIGVIAVISLALRKKYLAKKSTCEYNIVK